MPGRGLPQPSAPRHGSRHSTVPGAPGGSLIRRADDHPAPGGRNPSPPGAAARPAPTVLACRPDSYHSTSGTRGGGPEETQQHETATSGTPAAPDTAQAAIMPSGLAHRPLRLLPARGTARFREDRVPFPALLLLRIPPTLPPQPPIVHIPGPGPSVTSHPHEPPKLPPPHANRMQTTCRPRGEPPTAPSPRRSPDGHSRSRRGSAARNPHTL